MKPIGALALALFLVTGTGAIAADVSADQEQEFEMLADGAWHAGKNVPCAAGIVTSVHSRLEESPPGGRQTFGSGVVVELRLPSAPKFLNGQAISETSVVHYQDERGNQLMQSEKRGDKVQGCLTAFPTPSHDPKTGAVICDPNVDPRGLVFRVYDYRKRAAYVGPDSQHSCGGA